MEQITGSEVKDVSYRIINVLNTLKNVNIQYLDITPFA